MIEWMIVIGSIVYFIALGIPSILLAHNDDFSLYSFKYKIQELTINGKKKYALCRKVWFTPFYIEMDSSYIDGLQTAIKSLKRHKEYDNRGKITDRRWVSKQELMIEEL